VPLLALGQEQADPVDGVGHDLVEHGRFAHPEITGPAPQEAVDFGDDLFEGDQQPARAVSWRMRSRACWQARREGQRARKMTPLVPCRPRARPSRC
jgi:hypothetical protein